jgi:hypothetical protein
MSTSPTAAGRWAALKMCAAGLGFLGLNVVLLVFDGSYYPILMLLGVPPLLIGLAGLLFPEDFHIAAATPDPNALPALPGRTRASPSDRGSSSWLASPATRSEAT